jgi:hypothetical protein
MAYSKAACILINLAVVQVHVFLPFHCSPTLAINPQLIDASLSPLPLLLFSLGQGKVLQL